MQHHSGRPHHHNHHMHPQIHPGLPPPAINVAQPPQQPAQHHLSNVPPRGGLGPQQSKMYIPPPQQQQQQRESHRYPQKRFGHHLSQYQPPLHRQAHPNPMQHPKSRPPHNHVNAQMTQHNQQKIPIHQTQLPPHKTPAKIHNNAASNPNHRHQPNQYKPVVVKYNSQQPTHAISHQQNPNPNPSQPAVPVVVPVLQPTAILQNPDRHKMQHSSNVVTSTTPVANPMGTAGNAHSNTNSTVPVESQCTPEPLSNGPREQPTAPLNSILDSSAHEAGTTSKEKTPMCLVNELARYNKIQHQYRLTGEQGPAHCKKFTVTLKLGEEEYKAEGPSIKKAQHTAAADAIGKTSYEHPPPKTIRFKNGSRPGVGNITPTVELNALAMKMGKLTFYMFDGNPVPSQMGQGHPIVGNHPMHIPPNSYMPDGQFPHAFHRNNMMGNGRFPVGGRRPFMRGFPQHRMPFNPLGAREPCKITLMVGNQKFVGVGPSIQAAKHDAATRALEVLKPIVSSTTDAGSTHNSSMEDPNSDLKSPISLVHEMALKRNLTVTFEVLTETGPPHMRTFVTLCKVGNMTTEGEGNGKKTSKKKAAEKMMEELKKLPPLSPSKIPPVSANKLKNFKKKQPIVKKKSRNLIKENSEQETAEDINPISKLIQIQQALKEKEPVYRVVEEKGAPRRREFVIEVEANGHVATGYGTNKKRAKKSAAKNLLVLMGYENPGSADNENDLQSANMTDNVADSGDEEDEVELGHSKSSQGGSAGRQIVPGMLIVPSQKNPAIKAAPTNSLQLDVQGPPTVQEETKQSAGNCEGVRPKDQLMYLAQLLGFQAEFSNYPKGNHGEFLTIVTLTTDPPQICHGAGADPEASKDMAASTALKILSAIGLDNVKPKKSQNSIDETTAAVTDNSKE